MFENAGERERILDEYRACGEGSLVAEIEDEFFWDLESAAAHWTDAGFALATRRFSTLSLGLGRESAPS